MSGEATEGVINALDSHACGALARASASAARLRRRWESRKKLPLRSAEVK
jgi:hypothetical protein